MARSIMCSRFSRRGFDKIVLISASRISSCESSAENAAPSAAMPSKLSLLLSALLPCTPLGLTKLSPLFPELAETPTFDALPESAFFAAARASAPAKLSLVLSSPLAPAFEATAAALAPLPPAAGPAPILVLNLFGLAWFACSPAPSGLSTFVVSSRQPGVTIDAPTVSSTNFRTLGFRLVSSSACPSPPATTASAASCADVSVPTVASLISYAVACDPASRRAFGAAISSWFFCGRFLVCVGLEKNPSTLEWDLTTAS
jgi:hypothetical protein